MDPTYGPNNNPNQEVVVNVDVNVDAEAMIPTAQTTQTSLFHDELRSSNCEHLDALIGDGDGEGREEIIVNKCITRSSIVADDHSDGDEEEERQQFLKREKLYKAALKGDWKTAKSIFDMELTDGHETALQIAISAKQTAFVEKLVNLMSSSDLTSSALILAAVSGELRIAEVLVEKNPALPNIYDSCKSRFNPRLPLRL